MDTGTRTLESALDGRSTVFDSDEAASIAAAHALVQTRIDDACRRSNRKSAEIRVVAVSKGIPAERLRAAVAAGIETFGENRVQEAMDKVGMVHGASWHMIGPLQSNKARRAVETFATIQTVASIDLAIRLNRLAAELRPGNPLPVLLQVNVDADSAKAGFDAAELHGALPALLDLGNLRVDGLMTVGRLTPDPAVARSTFMGLRRLSEDLRAGRSLLGPNLSMGMSDDFEIAIEEGATMVRVGRALFGARPVRAG